MERASAAADRSGTQHLIDGGRFQARRGIKAAFVWLCTVAGGSPIDALDALSLLIIASALIEPPPPEASTTVVVTVCQPPPA